MPTFPSDTYEPLPSAVPGIDVYRFVEKQQAHQEIVTVTCPKCGGNQAKSNGQGRLTCIFCGHQRQAAPSLAARSLPGAQAESERYEFRLDLLSEARDQWAPGDLDLDCQRCGAHFTLPPQQLTHVCPFCHSQQVIQQKRREGALSPQALLPFQVKAADCAARTKAWLGGHWLLPGDLQAAVGETAFSPVYVPYWTFRARANANWQAEVGRERTETYYEDGERKTRTYTDWRWENGRVHTSFEDILVSGSEHLDPALLARADHFDLADLQPYQADYLVGIPAQAYEVSLEEAWKRGRQRIRTTLTSACRQDTGSDKVRNLSIEMELADEGWKYLLLPFFISSYTYADKTYQVIANGQTGDIGGYRPVAWWKLILSCVLALVPAFSLMTAGLLVGPPEPWLMGAAFALIIGIFVIYRLQRTAKGIDDD